MWGTSKVFYIIFFFNDTATTEIYTLSLHDALPISAWPGRCCRVAPEGAVPRDNTRPIPRLSACRSEEHTSELQSQSNLVCRLLLEKKKVDTVETDHALRRRHLA